MSGSAPRSLGRGGDGGGRRRRTSAGAGERGRRAHPAPDRGAALGPGAGRGGVLRRQLDAYPRQAPPGAGEGDPETVSRHGEGEMTPRRSRQTRADTRYNSLRCTGIIYRRQPCVGLGCSEPPQPKKPLKTSLFSEAFSFSSDGSSCFREHTVSGNTQNLDAWRHRRRRRIRESMARTFTCSVGTANAFSAG